MSCLLRSFLLKSERASRGVFKNCGKFVDSETLAELTFSFGTGQPAKALMSYFGVALRPASINFDLPTLPYYFMAHLSTNKLARTGCARASAPEPPPAQKDRKIPRQIKQLHAGVSPRVSCS